MSVALPISSTQRLVPGLIEQVGGQQGSSPQKQIVGETRFSDMMTDLIDSVNNLQKESAHAQEAFLAGEPVELHQVMIKAEEAGVSMDLLLEIRNKLLVAYQEIIRMPL
ncbi:MAG: flagellar hook-basal body complex protein FliE [Candidatus Zixiibacteriota bacterium]|nr:MAG: flagellar hook-basal body complex protein FliE [candidate division Zixibacteria bacterium]